MVYSTEHVLPLLLRGRADDIPDSPFMVDQGGAGLTYGEAYEAPRRWTQALARWGITKGDLVGCMLPHSVRAFTVWQGLSWLRATEVPIHDQIRGSGLVHILADSGVRLLVVDAGQVSRLVEIADRLAAVRTVVVCGSGPLPDLPCEVVDEVTFLDGCDPAIIKDDPCAHDIASVLYTSGTTGPSKGVLIPWPSIYASGLGSIPLDRLGPEDVFYHMGTTSHIGAKAFPFLMALAGGRIVVKSAFSRSEFWDDVHRFGVTTTVLFAAMPHFLMSEPESPDDARNSLSKVLMAPLPPWLPRFNERFGVQTTTAYGMTELPTAIASGFDIEDPQSCGKGRDGFPFCELRLVDENDYEVPAGEVGELIVRSPLPWSLNAGYLNNAAATATAWRNGWFHTGDAMRMDESGRFYFVDRLKDVIRRGGENISSFELESEINAHPGVTESAALAVPSAYGDDEVLVVVATGEGSVVEPTEMLDSLASRVARYMRPRYVQFVDSLPRTATQRVQKAELRRTAAERPTWDAVSKTWCTTPWESPASAGVSTPAARR